MSSRVSYTISFGPDANNSRRDGLKIERDPGAGDYQATTISFTAPNIIADSANGLGLYQVNDTLSVRGTALNSRRWVVLTTGAGSMTMLPNMIQTEAAGQPIIIQRDS